MKKLGEEKAKFEQISEALGSELSAVKADVQQFTTLHEKRVHDMNEALLAKSRKRAARRVYLSKKRAAEDRKRASEVMTQSLKGTKRILTSSFSTAAKGGNAASQKRVPKDRREVADKAGLKVVAAKVPAMEERDEKEEEEEEEEEEDGDGEKDEEGHTHKQEQQEEQDEEAQQGKEKDQEQQSKGKTKKETSQTLQLSVRPDGTLSFSLPFPGGQTPGSQGIPEDMQGMLSSMLAPLVSGRQTYEAVKQQEAMRLSQTLSGAVSYEGLHASSLTYNDGDADRPLHPQRRPRKSKRQGQRAKSSMWNTMPASSFVESGSATRDRKRSRRSLQGTVIHRKTNERSSPARVSKRQKRTWKPGQSGGASTRNRSRTARSTSYGNESDDVEWNGKRDEDKGGNVDGAQDRSYESKSRTRIRSRLSKRSSSLSPRRLAKRPFSSSSSKGSRASDNPVAASKSTPSSPRLPLGFRHSSRAGRMVDKTTSASTSQDKASKRKSVGMSKARKVEAMVEMEQQNDRKEEEQATLSALPATPVAGLEEILAEIERKGVEEREKDLQEKRRALAAENAAQIVNLEQALEKRRQEELLLLEETHFETRRLKQEQVRSAEEKKTTELIAGKRAALAADLEATMSSLQMASEAKRRRALAALKDALEDERQRVLQNVEEENEKKLREALADLATEMHRRKQDEVSRIRKKLAEEYGKKLSAARTEAEAKHESEIRKLRKAMRERSEASLTSLTEGMAEEHVAALAQVRVELEKESKTNARKMREELAARHKSRASRLATQIMDASSQALDKERTRLSKEYAELERAQGKQLGRKLRKERKEAISVLRLEMERRRQVGWIDVAIVAAVQQSSCLGSLNIHNTRTGCGRKH